MSERLEWLASVVVLDTLSDFVSGQDAIGFGDGAFAVESLGFNGVGPFMGGWQLKMRTPFPSSEHLPVGFGVTRCPLTGLGYQGNRTNISFSPMT